MNKEFIQRIKQQFGLIGHSVRLDTALQVAVQVSPTDIRVLIHGPSGCGKESFSKIIHALSRRKHNTFIAVNCGAIPEGTIDSELFGHERGAFTGAQEVRKGYFETANKGTIFLDEVGELPLSTQARLLRVLENGEYLRVGASRAQKTDVRIIAATNVDLRKAVEEKKFREDLYYRLNTVPIYVPALSERKEDIVLLFESFVLDACEQHKRTSLSLAKDVPLLLERTHFPGNIRQLKNLAEQVSLLETEPVLTSEVLQRYLPQASGAWLPAVVDKSDESERAEKELLYTLLFDMRKDVHELKKLIHQILQNKSDGHALLDRHSHLFEEIKEVEKPSSLQGSYTLPAISVAGADSRPKVKDIVHESSEKGVLSLQVQEKGIIDKALRKHAYKRKTAAEELGISERTLYRKIKHYGL